MSLSDVALLAGVKEATLLDYVSRKRTDIPKFVTIKKEKYAKIEDVAAWVTSMFDFTAATEDREAKEDEFVRLMLLFAKDQSIAYPTLIEQNSKLFSSAFKQLPKKKLQLIIEAFKKAPSTVEPKEVSRNRTAKSLGEQELE